VEIRGEPRPLNGAVNTALFRMAQEALTNTVKHAHARRAELHLLYGEQAVTLTVEDDGEGFDAARRGKLGAWGLMGMEERAHLLGGEVRIESERGGGTQVDAVFPYDAEAKEPNGYPTTAGG
jgi:signal transduction histidine kinase